MEPRIKTKKKTKKPHRKNEQYKAKTSKPHRRIKKQNMMLELFRIDITGVKELD